MSSILKTSYMSTSKILSFFDSFPRNHNRSLRNVKSLDAIGSKSISTPIQHCSQGELYNTSTIGRPNIPNGSDITLYKITKDVTAKGKVDSITHETLQFRKGELVQSVSKVKDPNYIYVRKIDSIGEGLVPISSLQEYEHLPYKPSNNNNNSMGFTKESSPITSTAGSHKSHQYIMGLTPPTSPLTIDSNTFSIGSLSRNPRFSPISSSTLYEKLFDIESRITSMNIEAVENKDERITYVLKITNQLNQECWKEIYYQDLYNLHLGLISHPSYNSYELFLPRLPSPLTLSSIKGGTEEQVENSSKDNTSDGNNTRVDRLQQMDSYVQSMFKSLSMESDTSILKHIWFDSILKKNDIYIDKNITVKIKVLYKGDYHVIRCRLCNINTLNKLQTTVSSKVNHDQHSLTTVYTAVLDGWYKINLSNEDIYGEVLVKIRQSKRLTLEVYDPNLH